MLVGHVSMHGAVLNSAAMKKWNITAETRTPPGGVILRKPGSNEPAGLLMETAYLPIFASLPKPTREQEVDMVASRTDALCPGRDHDGPRRGDACRRARGHEARGQRRRQHHRHHRLSFHHRPGQGAGSQPGERLGQVRQAAEDRRRQDHDRWLAPGQDGLSSPSRT